MLITKLEENKIYLMFIPLYDLEIVSGKNCCIYDKQGREYLDLYGGHAVIPSGIRTRIMYGHLRTSRSHRFYSIPW